MKREDFMKLVATGAITPVIASAAGCSQTPSPQKTEPESLVTSSNNSNIQQIIITENAFNSIAALKKAKLDTDEAKASSISSNPNKCVQVLGYYKPGDGGGGLFYWDDESEEEDNGGTTIEPAIKGFSGTGRWKRVETSRPKVEWFGAKGDGTSDDTAAFNQALSLFSTIYASQKTYRINETIQIGEEQTLILDRSVLNRGGSSTDPVVRFVGRRGSLSGGSNGYGTIQSTINNSPQGIIAMSSSDPETIGLNILWNQVHNIKVFGNGDTSTIGFRLRSSEPYTTGATYTNTISDCLIENVGTGVRLGSICNGNTFHNIHFYNIQQYCYHFAGAEDHPSTSQKLGENMVQMGFVHFSQNLTSMIKLESSIYSLFYNITGEAGGGQFYNIDRKSNDNQIFGHDNFPSVSVNNQTRGIIADGRGLMQLDTLNTHALNVTGDVSLPYGTEQIGTKYAEQTKTINFETVFLKDQTKSSIKIAGLKRNTTKAYRSGLFYEIRLKGFAAGSSGNKQFSATRMVNAYNFTTNDQRLDLELIGTDSNVTVSSDNSDQSITFILAANGWKNATYGEIIVSIRATGVGVGTPKISFS